MKKILSLIFAVLMITSALQTSAFAVEHCDHEPGEPIIEPATRFQKGSRSVYCTICHELLEYEEIPEIPFHEVGRKNAYSDVAINVDGDISEWLNMFDITAENVRNYVGRIPIDLNFRTKLGFCWDSDKLYIAGYYEDDTYVYSDGRTYYEGFDGDTAIISFDFNGICKRYYMSFAPNYSISLENYEGVDEAVITCTRYNGSNVELQADVKGKRLENGGWQFECAIPWTCIIDDFNNSFKREMGWTPGITLEKNVVNGSLIHVLHAYADIAIDESYGSKYHKATYSTTSDAYGNIGNGRQIKEAGIFMSLSSCSHETLDHSDYQPDCTEPGVRTNYCANCGEIFGFETIAAHDHGETYFKVTREPSCSREGIETEYCRDCAAIVSTLPVEKLPHTPGDWEFDRYPTYEENGRKVRKCLVCGQDAVEEEILPPAWTFTDVSENAWYYTPVRNIFCRGYMVGISDTKFVPDAVVTRGMFVTILASVAEYDPEEYKDVSYFSDVSAADWYAPAVEWAHINKITEGYGDRFGANDPVTREQMVIMLRKFAEIFGFANEKYADLRYFKDYLQIDSWAEAALSWAVCSEFISGTTPDLLSPKGVSTRAQVATVLNKFTKASDKK